MVKESVVMRRSVESVTSRTWKSATTKTWKSMISRKPAAYSLFVMLAVLLLVTGCFSTDVKNVKENAQDSDKNADAERALREAVQAACSNGVMDQGETGIDCGGPCSPCPVQADADDDNGLSGEGDNDSDIDKDSNDSDSGTDILDSAVDVIIIQYEISSENLKLLKEKLTQGTQATFLTNSYPTGLEVGKSNVYAFGLTNMHLNPEEFSFTIEFSDAKDMKSNPIPVDPETVLSWFDNNNLENVMLDRYAQAFIPVGVTVGDEVAPGIKTQSGNYYFNLIVEYNDGGIYRLYDEKEFSFRVI
ncbi:hypothetical protein JXB31_05110 [Candidatus Woesearchaeota archaeon]|nr:hypothetical protein [Candidatus Woesearchaeota archaeon]